MGSLTTALERAHLEPGRPHLAQARRIVRGAATGREAWERLASEGLVAPGERWFRVTARELARAGHRDGELRRINLSSICATERALVLPHPGTPEAAIAFASVDGLLEAEQHAREYLVRIEPFRFLIRHRAKPGARAPVWRILGSPIAAPSAAPSPIDIEGAWELAELASQLANEPLPQRAAPRFFHVATHAAACTLWSKAERPIPAHLQLSGDARHWTPRALLRTRLAHHPNPFEPLLAIWRLGFGIRRLNEQTILLFLPHSAPSTDAKRSRSRIAAFGEEALRQAVLRAETVPAIEILERGVDPNGEDARGRTALHCAIMAGHRTQTALLAALISAGADPDREDDDGMTPLALSVAYDQRRLARALFELGLDPKQRLGGGRSLLHVAARSGSARMIALLLEHDLDADIRCARGRTPLHEAAMGRASYSVEAATSLLDHGSDPNVRDRFGWTPLHYAAINPYGTTMAELLVDRGARSLPDRGGRLPTDLGEQETMPRAIARALRGVATPLDPLPDPARNAELEAAIHASPGDDNVWSVYADWLASCGEPHAELIQLGVATKRARGDERARLRRALQHARDDRLFEIYGELQRIEPTIAAAPHPEYRFEHGFLVQLDHRGSITALRDILSTNAARFLRHLSASGAHSVLQLLEAIGSPSLESIALSFCAAPLLRQLATALPRVRRLRLHGLLPRAIEWPLLEELSFVAAGARLDDPSHLDADLPDLRALRLTASDDRDRARLLALARAPLPKLASFAWRGPGSSFRELSHADWFARIERLDLVRADPEVIARLEQIVPERANLRRVRVVAPHLGTREKRALAARLSVFVRRVRVS